MLPRLHVIRLAFAYAVDYVLEVFEGPILLERDLGLIRLYNELALQS